MLPEEVLNRRTQLPTKPDALTHNGQYVTLIPYTPDHAAALHDLSNGSPIHIHNLHQDVYDANALIWQYMFSGPFDTLNDFEHYMDGQLNAANGRPFTVVDNELDHPVGIINLMNNAPEHLKVELGSIWYSPIAQRTHANLEATTLLLSWAFDSGYRRVEWKCNTENVRSRRSALRMGFTYEGTQESHMIVKGVNRDTAWFRILDREWADVSQRLAGLLQM